MLRCQAPALKTSLAHGGRDTVSCTMRLKWRLEPLHAFHSKLMVAILVNW